MSKKKNKKKHNKKRNTAFLYEVLVREITKCVLEKDRERQAIALQICKEHFRKGTLLHQERELYSTILETTGLEKEVPKKIENFEFLWRLRYETIKRVSRLFITGLNFVFYYVLTKKDKKIL